MAEEKEDTGQPVKFLQENDVLGLKKPDPKNLNKSPGAEPPKKKKAWLAAVLGLLMIGLGHFYAGKVKKGVFFYFGLIFIALSIRFIAFEFYIFATLFAAIIGFYLYSIIDAYLSVKRNPIVAPKKYDKWYIYVVLILLQNILIEVLPKGALDTHTVINFASIPNPAMSPTLRIGDIVAYQRTSEIEMNDIVVFKYPTDTNTLYIKRCIGMPGSTVEVKAGNAFVDDKMIDNTKSLWHQYILTSNGQEIRQKFFESYVGRNPSRISPDTYRIFLTEEEAGGLEKQSIFKGVNKQIGVAESSSYLFPNNNAMYWTVEYFGPIHIPKKGETIQLTDTNIELYASILQSENTDLRISDTLVELNDQSISDYTFKNNYYFMLGDSRHNSADSRFWGFVAEGYIIGSARYLYWAEDPERIGTTFK